MGLGDSPLGGELPAAQGREGVVSCEGKRNINRQMKQTEGVTWSSMGSPLRDSQDRPRHGTGVHVTGCARPARHL